MQILTAPIVNGTTGAVTTAVSAGGPDVSAGSGATSCWAGVASAAVAADPAAAAAPCEYTPVIIILYSRTPI